MLIRIVRDNQPSCETTKSHYLSMRSFFNKPSWASRGNEDEDGDSEFYRRAGQTYKDIVATNKSARERRASSFQSSPHKRRRVSSSSKDGSPEGSSSGQDARSEQRDLPENPPSPYGTPRDVNRDSPPMAQQSHPDDALSMDTKGSTSPKPRASPKSPLSELRADPTPLPPTHTISNKKADTHANHRFQDQGTPSETSTSRNNVDSANDQAVVQILITSKIANTKSLIIYRKMSQSLKGVRLAWCTRQNLPKDFHSTVFLTWKGRRLFDVTTCRSLNIDAHSAFTKELSPFGDIFSDTDDICIRMEAVTEEIFAAGNRSSPNIIGFNQTPPSSTEHQNVAQQAQSTVVLKCPGFDDLKIRVPLETQIYKVIAAFREARSLSTDTDVYFAFDGGRLDPHSCLADYEIVDGDLIDVLVKKAM
ncbi:ubiquitin-2 like Rad60 SUMO-like-domain-containing protein [Aspergillus cavernicola]|uniref:Ubiquitin-2 like Rad60 SUMO-like-domain-containing protein n=1 Tax=Aspergillus cavernicola TaxID=176166 RepID=A0ABR4ILG1_9EURO